MRSSSSISDSQPTRWNRFCDCWWEGIKGFYQGLTSSVDSLKNRIWNSSEEGGIEEGLLLAGEAPNSPRHTYSVKKYLPLAVSGLAAAATIGLRFFKDSDEWAETSLEIISGGCTSYALLEAFELLGGRKAADETKRWIQALAQAFLFRATQFGVNHEEAENKTTSLILFWGGLYLGSTLKGIQQNGYFAPLPNKISGPAPASPKAESLFSNRKLEIFSLATGAAGSLLGGLFIPSSYKAAKVFFFSVSSHLGCKIFGQGLAFVISTKIEGGAPSKGVIITDIAMKTLTTPSQMVLGIVVGNHATSDILEILAPLLLALMGFFDGYVGYCQKQRVESNPKEILPELRKLEILPNSLKDIGCNPKTAKALFIGLIWLEIIRFSLSQIIEYHKDPSALSAMTALGITSFLGLPLTWWVTASWEESDPKIKSYLFSFLNINFPGIEPAVLYGLVTSLMEMNDTATRNATKINAAIIGGGWGALGLAMFMAFNRLIREGTPLKPASLVFLLSWVATITVKLRKSS